MKVFSVDFSRAQRGWVCRAFFKVTTARQFTDEIHMGVGYSRWALLALWRARRDARHVYAKLVARPGERAALGWAD